jgi:hypothetical protein
MLLHAANTPKQTLRLRSLLNAIGLLSLCVCHLSVLGVLCGWCLGLLLRLCFPLCTLELGLLGGVLLLMLLHGGLLLTLDLVVVALNDGTGNGADVLLLGDVLCF